VIGDRKKATRDHFNLIFRTVNPVERRKKVIGRLGAAVMIGSPPTHAAVTAFATRAKRCAIVRAGERRAVGSARRFSHRIVHVPPAQPSRMRVHGLWCRLTTVPGRVHHSRSGKNPGPERDR